MAQTKIEWTEKTWNPTVGCNKVSPGCKFCYAEVMHRRLMKMQPEKYSRPFLEGAFPHEPSLEIPLHWKKPSMIFVNSMSDLFHEKVPFEFIHDVFNVIAKSPQHIFQILTKRPEIASKYFEHHTCWDNVWFGVSAENQKEADERRDYLRSTPAKIKFVSYEPALENVNWEKWDFLDWFIAGGESGPKARPSHPDWFRNARDFCKEKKIPFLFKQWGEHSEHFNKVGKKIAGRLLDGKLHDEYPEVRNAKV